MREAADALRIGCFIFVLQISRTMYGYVFYPDGGARQQREYSGCGIHGYRWDTEAGAKSIGHNSQTTTMRGYDVKGATKEWLVKSHKGKIPEALGEQIVLAAAEAKAKVGVTKYFDAAIPLAYGGTNNTAELKGAVRCLKLLLREPDLEGAAKITIRQDSMYVVDGVNKHLPKWVARNFIRGDGSTAPNSDIWREMQAVLSALESKGIPLSFEWVEAHAGCIGNGAADQLATVALFKARESRQSFDSDDIDFMVSEPENYWDAGGDTRHPLMNFRYCFLDISESGAYVDGEYFLSSQGKDVNMNGKRTAGDGFSVVRTSKVKMIEDIREFQLGIPREIDYRFQLDLNNVYGSAYRYLNLYGDSFLHRKHDHVRHLFVGDELVTEELHPPYLVENIISNCTMLADLLDNYKSDDTKTLRLTDITDTLYMTEDKPVKVKKGEEARTEQVCTLNSDIVVGYSKHKVTVGYRDSDKLGEAEINLRVGVDFPDRNMLKRIEDTKPRVYILTSWLGGAFMYSTVIESGGDVAIWCGINSSIRVIGKGDAPAA